MNSVTLVLDAADFVQLYYAAAKGAQWKTGSSTNNRLIQVGGCLRALTGGAMGRL